MKIIQGEKQIKKALPPSSKSGTDPLYSKPAAAMQNHDGMLRFGLLTDYGLANTFY
jgi:hypothetical protein